MGSSNDDAGDDHGGNGQNRREVLWRTCIAVGLLAFIIFLISIYEDPGPVCGTGQDKGPC
ncbi:hypothetical protein ACF1G0_22545 [Streptomyces sp. NPDC013953]|uniref:hypothetical protein n=1 Tax=Streptomyces sp. NPDC013953 TaxID=3364868 RepID=UPI0036F56FE1